MDRVLWQQLLAQAERHVAEAQGRISMQKDIISKLERSGADATRARDLLATFEALQAAHIAHRDRLRRELAI